MAASSSSSLSSSSSSAGGHQALPPLPAVQAPTAALVAQKSASPSLEVLRQWLECTVVSIKGVADVATNRKRRLWERSLKQHLFIHLNSALIQTNLLPKVLVDLINDYAAAALQDNPSCFALHSPSPSWFLGFNVGSAGIKRDNALFVTLGTSTPTPSARVVRMEHAPESDVLVGSSWPIAYSSSYKIQRPHIVQTSATELRIESDEGFGFPWRACYDPHAQRVWRKENTMLVGLATENSKEIRCAPTGLLFTGAREVLFGQSVSPSRMVSVHRDALRLFATDEVDVIQERNLCRQLEYYDPGQRSVAATAIPNSNRFIAALKATGIIFFSPDLVHDRFTIQHAFVIKNRDKIEGYDSIGEVLSIASHATALATVLDVTARNEGFFMESPAFGLWDCGVSLWDHESAQRISHVTLPFCQGLSRGQHGSWFADNGVLILDHTHVYREMEQETNRFVVIDFRMESPVIPAVKVIPR